MDGRRPWLSTVAAADVRLSRTTMLADEEDVTTWYDRQTAQGDLPTLNWSHVQDGLITRIRATFDPRPLL